MAVLPTQFIARIPQYPQNVDYGQYCTDSAKELACLLQQPRQNTPPIGLDEVNAFFGPKLLEYFVERPNDRRTDGVRIGNNRAEIRKHVTGTPLNDAGVKYMHYAREAILAHSDALGDIHSVVDGKARIMLDDRKQPIPLSEINRSGLPKDADGLERHLRHMRYPKSLGTVDIFHSVTPDKPEYEPAKAAFNEALNEALGTQPLTHSTSREEAALKSYYLYSHIMPFQRYSSSAARMLLEALAEVTLLRTYHMAENRDINLEALVRNWSDFKQAHEKGSFWDKRASPADVTRWQARAIAKQDNTDIASSLKDYVHDAIYVEAMGDQAEIFSSRRTLFKELIDRTKNPASPEDKASDGRIKPLLGQYDDLEEKKRWIANPITLCTGVVDYDDESGAHKQARGIQFGCSNWDESDIQFSDLFLRKHVHESFPEGERSRAFDTFKHDLQEPHAVLTEHGELVRGTLRPFNPDEVGQLKREYAVQQRQSTNGYVYGAPKEGGRNIGG